MSEYQNVRYEVENRVARITLDRPRYRNAQSRVLLEELDQAFLRADSDRGVNVIVLLGEGEHFSAGHDLGTPEEMEDREARPWQEGIRGWYDHTYEHFFANTMRWRNLSKPTVAGVQGYCIFGGWMIASAMDVVIAGRSAMFLGSLFQYFSMPWDLSPRKVKELLFESRFVDAVQAEELGLVNRVVADDDVAQATIAWAEQVAENDPFWLRMTKTAVNNAQDAQGFPAHMKASHAFYCLSRMGESDPDAPQVETGARRRPMVQIALDNYHRHLKQPDEG
ncbi:MAG: enoyl-CoA hydratase [Gammaproteobacteria bacterium]|jgi:enoyl-CoA hydratase